MYVCVLVCVYIYVCMNVCSNNNQWIRGEGFVRKQGGEARSELEEEEGMGEMM